MAFTLFEDVSSALSGFFNPGPSENTSVKPKTSTLDDYNFTNLGDPADLTQGNSLVNSYGPDPVLVEDSGANFNSLTNYYGPDPVVANDAALSSTALDDFFLDNSEDLDEIAAKYGVDPTSEQARELWEQEYGGGLDVSGPSAFSTVQGNYRKAIEKTDWRFRISLSPQADYLYSHPAAATGILAPLIKTDGVIFPYTPQVTIPNQAEYQSYNLTHSNHRGYFYKGSYTGEIMVNATFTAQDTAEAEYLLAVITFFRAATKMFYGQDAKRGTPPPLLYMRGFGDFGFNEHPCVLSTFNVVLPDNVDYVRTHVGPQQNSEWTGRMQASQGTNNSSWSSRITRLVSSGLSGNGWDVSGALGGTFGNIFGVAQQGGSGAGASGTGSSFKGNETYVPSEIQLSLILLPVQTRDQVSNKFSLEQFANGELIKQGYW